MRRQRALVGGRRVAVGSYQIDLRTPFPSCPRIVKSTGITPDLPSARERVNEMKLMVRDLIANRDVECLTKIYRGDLKLLDAYHFWKQGRISQADIGLHLNLLTQLNHYITTNPRFSEATRTRGKATVNVLLAKSFLNEHHTVRDLPEVLTTARHYYWATKKPDMYNNTRNMLMGFLRVGLHHDKSSHVYSQLSQLRPLEAKRRKEHHPLTHPHDFVGLLDLIRTRESLPQDTRDRCVQAVVMMCFHGHRPTEFFEGKWGRDNNTDTNTGHLHIKGTKTEESDRVVPMCFYYKGYHRNPLQLASFNRLLERLGTPIRARDFRRTYSVWMELAGIPRSRLQHFLGHKGREQVDTYQQYKPTRDLLNQDRDTLLRWFESELTKPPVRPPSPYAPSTSQFLQQLFHTPVPHIP